MAQEVAKGTSAIDAYTKAGYKPNRSHASRLVAQGNICDRVAEPQGSVAKAVKVTIESLSTELEEARGIAIEEKQTSAAVAATMGKAKLFGFLTEKHQHSVDDPLAQLLRDVSGSAYRPTNG